jgi:hypothetical protein
MNLAGIEVTKAIAAAGLKITPDVLVGGGGDGGSANVFAAFIAQLLAQNRSALTNGPSPAAAQAPGAAPPESKP